MDNTRITIDYTQEEKEGLKQSGDLIESILHGESKGMWLIY
jgi:hypothetical protein